MGSTRNRYDEDFKKSLVSLYQDGKTQSSICREYGVSQTALSRWIKAYSTVTTEDGETMNLFSLTIVHPTPLTTCI